jgi:hypothetical protein
MTEASNGSTSNDAPKALIPKPSMGAIAAQADPAELAELVYQSRQVLNQLAVDSTLPEATRNALVALAASASTQKRGVEEMEVVWRPLRCMIVQPTTRSEIKPPMARPGDIFDSGGQLLTRPTPIIPLYIHEENINFPENGKNPVCSAPDAKLGSPYGKCIECPHLPFGKQNGGRGEQKKTDCQNAITVFAMTADLKQIYQFQFAKTSRKAGGILMSLAGRQDVLWKQSYMLNTEKKTNEIGLYYIYTVEQTNKDNPEDVQRVCEAFYGLIAAQRKQFLADYYSRPARAPIAAAEAEGNFAGDEQLAAGLGGSDGEEPDLVTPAAAPAPSPSKGARNSSKPM